jgi:hypothetical protein
LCDDGSGRKQSNQYVYAYTLLVDKHAQQQAKRVCFFYDDKTKQFFFSFCASPVEMNRETDFLVLFSFFYTMPT